MNLISVCFCIQSILWRINLVCEHIIWDAISIAIIGFIQIGYLWTTVSCMILGVLECSFTLCGGWIKVFICSADSVPVITIDNWVVVFRRIIVAKFNGTSIYTVDIPPLCVVLAECFIGIVCNPCRCVVIRQREEIGDAFLSTDKL